MVVPVVTMKYVSRSVAGVIAVVIVVFAIANRGDVVVSFSPLPFTVQIPLYAVLLATAALGALAGGVGAWFAAGRVRARARRQRRQIQSLEDELTAAVRGHGNRQVVAHATGDNG